MNCVWKESEAVLGFNEAENADLSTIDFFSGTSFYREARRMGERYDVKSISRSTISLRSILPRN